MNTQAVINLDLFLDFDNEELDGMTLFFPRANVNSENGLHQILCSLRQDFALFIYHR
jgi:hypothetical protein